MGADLKATPKWDVIRSVLTSAAELLRKDGTPVSELALQRIERALDRLTVDSEQAARAVVHQRVSDILRGEFEGRLESTEELALKGQLRDLSISLRTMMPSPR